MKIKKFFTYFLLSLFLVLASFNFVQAGLLKSDTVDKIEEKVDYARDDSYGDQTLSETIAIIIKAFLSLVGVIFIILMIVGGFNWMTAAGDEKKVEKAQETIKRAVIGVIIVIAAYSITYFIFAVLPGSDPGTGGVSGSPSSTSTNP